MKRRVVALGVAVALVAAAEFGARTLSVHLREPLLWADPTTATKVEQLAAIRDGPGCVNVVFVGNSMTRDAIDPARFERADPAGRRAYNGALDAASPTLLRRWVGAEVLPAARPDTVVIGLTSFDFNDDSKVTGSALRSYDAAPLSRDDFFGRWQAPLLRQFDLVRYRGQLRDPAELWRTLGRWRRGERPDRFSAAGLSGLIGPKGEGLSRRELHYVPNAAGRGLVERELLNDYATGGAQVQAAAALVQELRAQNVEVVLVALPVTADYIDLHPRGAVDFERFLAQAQALGSGPGVEFLDRHDWARDSEFADTHHLNGAGADRFSADLAATLPAGARSCLA